MSVSSRVIISLSLIAIYKIHGTFEVEIHIKLQDFKAKKCSLDKESSKVLFYAVSAKDTTKHR